MLSINIDSIEKNVKPQIKNSKKDLESAKKIISSINVPTDFSGSSKIKSLPSTLAKIETEIDNATKCVNSIIEKFQQAERNANNTLYTLLAKMTSLGLSNELTKKLQNSLSLLNNISSIKDPTIRELLLKSDSEIWEILTGTAFDSKPKPNQITAETMASKIESINVPIRTKDGNSNMNIEVNKELANVFTSFFNDIYNECPDFYIIPENTYGYTYKKTTGSNQDVLSAHSFGAAVDINSSYNVQGNDPPNEKTNDYVIFKDSHMVEIIKRYTMCWGGYFTTSKPDGMHISFIGDWSRLETFDKYKD